MRKTAEALMEAQRYEEEKADLRPLIFVLTPPSRFGQVSEGFGDCLFSAGEVKLHPDGGGVG